MFKFHFVFIVLISSLGLAYGHSLQSSLKFAQLLYNDKIMGNDLNFVAGKVFPKNQSLIDDQKIVKKLLRSKSSIIRAIKNCVFMKDGANEEHINTQRQNYIALKYLRHLNRVGLRSRFRPEFYIVFNFHLKNADYNSPCGLYFYQPQEQSLYLSSHSLRFGS